MQKEKEIRVIVVDENDVMRRNVGLVKIQNRPQDSEGQEAFKWSGWNVQNDVGCAVGQNRKVSMVSERTWTASKDRSRAQGVVSVILNR